MVNVKYIGTSETKVRVSGIKIDIEPGQIFEMPDEEAKILIEGPYRNLFIKDWEELGPKQNTENNKFQDQKLIWLVQDKYTEMTIWTIKEELKKLWIELPKKADKDILIALLKANESKEEKENTNIEELLEKIRTVETIDLLNAISTDVANDESLSENEEISDAIEEKMTEFLTENNA